MAASTKVLRIGRGWCGRWCSRWGFRADPAVELDGDVEGLRAVGDVVAEPSGVEEDGGFDGFGVLMSAESWR